MAQYYTTITPEMSEREKLHETISREIASECIVLLKNDGVLPLENVSRIALYGAGARDTIAGGTGSGDVYVRKTVSVEQGLENAGFIITTKKWLDRQERKIDRAKKLFSQYCQEEAEKTNNAPFMIAFNHPFKEPPAEQITEQDVTESSTDVAIYVLHRISGEGADRFDIKGDYYLYNEEKESINFLASHYKKVVIVLNIGGIIDIKEICDNEKINAIILMTQLGSAGGDALADILSGKVNPSGKTTDTWAENYSDYPSSGDFSHNGSLSDEYYTEGIYVGYRYFDTFDVKPKYPFGFGLSYTSFQISFLSAQIYGDKIETKFCVRNTGTRYAGKEIIQIYYNAPADDLDKPVKELIAFKKTPLINPGQNVNVSIVFDIKDMASYSQKEAAWVLEKGNYHILAGNSSLDLLEIASISIDTDIKSSICRNVFNPDIKMQEMKCKKKPKKIFRKVQNFVKLKLNSGALKREEVIYQQERRQVVSSYTEHICMDDIQNGKYAVEDLVSQLTVDEMAEMCVGTLREKNGSVIGNASQKVPGAAGDTSSVLEKTRNIPGIIMADGPAGLRLQPHFQKEKDGKIIDCYQYCTAIPIGWALAQSWNTELVEKIGYMIGTEMEEFQIDLWLAPALNIHRNPLCGRNFEYYSEDPVVSGTIAASIVKGVQKHEGKGTTIKHFAANNQEDNRYFLNAHVSERAMREIYLKGFEIVVKNEQPMALMTSYNLINGIHAANSRELIQYVLRDEWGFKGMVMTDWFTSQDLPAFTGKFNAEYPISSSVGCIYAGNDLQMPGCQKNVHDIVEAVKNQKNIDGYNISIADIQFCTANIIRIILKILE